MTRVVIAADSFKGSATANEVNAYLAAGVTRVAPGTTVEKAVIADGGAGTVKTVINAVGGQFKTTQVLGPLGQPVEAQWGLLDAHTAIIEVSAAVGLTLAQPNLAPVSSSTLGVGQLISAALDQGATTIYVGLGDSATTDGGAGMMAALGAGIIDSNQQKLDLGGGSLMRLGHVSFLGLDPRLKQTTLIGLTDVTNPLTGPEGAAAVFGPQKGAEHEMVARLNQGLARLRTFVPIPNALALSRTPGAGAAGGTGFGLLALGGQLQSGAQAVQQLTHMAQRINGADLVITGEGRVDGQSLRGKAPIAVVQLARTQNVPTALVAGSVLGDVAAIHAAGVDDVVVSTPADMPVADAMRQTPALLTSAGAKAMLTYLASRDDAK